MPSATSTLFVDTEPELAAAVRVPVSDEGARIATLSSRLVAGEEAAWREFHEEYFDRLLRYLFVVCRGDEQAARDGLQAAFVKIARHIRRFDRAEAFWGWLTVVARSCVVDGARGQSRYRALLERYAGVFNVPTARVESDPLDELLEECLGALPEADRALVAAKYNDGDSTATLAMRAGCSEKAIESRLARIRHRLKDQLLIRLRHET